MGKVSIVPWGNIENPDAPKLWGLKVGKAYVAKGNSPALYQTREEAVMMRDDLQHRLDRREAKA